MEQPNEQPIESIQSSKNIWMIVIAVIATALIVGRGAYAWQRSILKNTRQSMQQQISVLQNQISQLQQMQANRPVVEQNNQSNQLTAPTQPSYEFMFTNKNNFPISQKEFNIYNTLMQKT